MKESTRQISDTDAPTAGHHVVQVAVGRTAWLGALNYLCEHAATDILGHVVSVEFGAGVSVGIVVGEGDASKATKRILKVGPKLVSDATMSVYIWAARRWMVPLPVVVSRAVPTSVIANIDDWESPPVAHTGRPDPVRQRQYLALAPKLDLAETAAATAVAQAVETHGQVMIVVASGTVAEKVATHVCTEASKLGVGLRVRRLDRGHKGWEDDWWSWRMGRVDVGVALRSAIMWEPATPQGWIVVDAEHPGHVEAKQPHTRSGVVAAAFASAQDRMYLSIGRVPEPTSVYQTRFETLGTKVRDWPAMRTTRNADPLPSVVKHSLGSDAVAVASGAGSMVVCRQCRERLVCASCGGPLTAAGCATCGTRKAATCGRCGSSSAVVRGWDVHRARRVLDSAGLTSMPVITPSLIDTTEAGTWVIFNPDRISGGDDPGLSSARTILRAAARADVVWLVGAAKGGVGDTLARTHRVDTIAKRAWEDARTQGLAPFRRQVTVRIAGRKPDGIGGLRKAGVEVHGPKEGPDGWTLRMRGRDIDMDLVAAWVQTQRSAGRKLRVDVH